MALAATADRFKAVLTVPGILSFDELQELYNELDKHLTQEKKEASTQTAQEKGPAQESNTCLMACSKYNFQIDIIIIK